jgi:membrane protease YdiL (CAAX protease family)
LPATLGLGAPALRAAVLAAAISAALLVYFPLFARLTGTELAIRPGAALLAAGIFAQGGIAEEALFRGLLYRRLRAGRSFWPGACIAAVPFVLAHAALFATLDFALALGALLVSLSLTFPLARLVDLARGSIWPGAAVHAVIQGAIKLVEPASQDSGALALGWLAVSAAAPWIVFAFPVRSAVPRGATLAH